MRVSQRQMYYTMTGQMNMNLSQLMESHMQGATLKRVNKPSDDPAGISRILQYRSSLENIAQYKQNAGTALGWLNTADTTLIQVDEAISEIKSNIQQIATGTVTAENREQVSYALRQALGKLIGLANTQFEGQHIFAGHKTGSAAYIEGVGAHSNSTGFENTRFVAQSITGSYNKSVVVQATSAGTIGDAAPFDFRYSEDGGKTWQTGTSTQEIDANGNAWSVLTMGGVEMKIMAEDPPQTVTPVDTDNPNENDNGTWFYVHPTAVYQGDDNDAQVVQGYGSAATGTADGYFTRDVAVRIDSVAGGKITYSYSTDDGSTWVGGLTATDSSPADTRLAVPGGYLTLNGPIKGEDLTTTPPTMGDQFVIRPHRADINLEVSPGQNVTINMVGKDIFGGLYKAPFAEYAEPVTSSRYGKSGNLFEMLGKAITYAETNNQQGLQSCLDELNDSLQVVLTKAAEVGGRETRVSVVQENLGMRELSETDNLSKIEDVDVTMLMTRLAQQQLAYNMVLKSSSMIMQMNLMNFI